MGAPLPVDKSLTIAAAICGAAGLGIGIATGSAPLMIFAGTTLGNVFANLATDACKAASDHYKLIAAGPGAPAQNHDLALLAAKAIAAVVEESMKDFERDRAGFGFLQSAAAIKPDVYKKVLALPEFRDVGTDQLVQFLGLPEGGITAQAANDSIWYALLVEALKQSNPRGDLAALAGPSTQGVSFAAHRLWERFPAQFNGELRDDPKYGGRAWVAFQSTMMKRSVEAAEATRAELKSHRQEWRTFADRVNAVLNGILAGEVIVRLAADDPVVIELRQTRNLVGSIYARLELLTDGVGRVDDTTTATHRIVEYTAGEVATANVKLESLLKDMAQLTGTDRSINERGRLAQMQARARAAFWLGFFAMAAECTCRSSVPEAKNILTVHWARLYGNAAPLGHAFPQVPSTRTSDNIAAIASLMERASSPHEHLGPVVALGHSLYVVGVIDATGADPQAEDTPKSREHCKHMLARIGVPHSDIESLMALDFSPLKEDQGMRLNQILEVVLQALQ
jgi:hypothetical protein